MNTQNVWIKRSERDPFTSEFPLCAGYYTSEGAWEEYRIERPEAPLGSATHFRSIKAEPPPRGSAQRERDERLARNIAMAVESTVAECALEAIYAERREVLKLMSDWFGDPNWGTQEGISPRGKSIRARLDEQGAK